MTTLSRQTPLIYVAKKKSLIGKILLCFSLLNNFLGIIRRSTHRYATLDGARVFYLAWLTYSNTYFYSLRYGTNINYESIQPVSLHNFGFSLLNTLPLIAAGSYYFISGFLSLNWLLHMQAVKYGRSHCCMLLGRYYVYRLIRIWPVYLYILFGTLYLSGVFVTGPQYQDYEQTNYYTNPDCLHNDADNLNSCDYHVCQYYWNIFFLNSVVTGKSCLQPWSSFFGTDMLCVLILPMLVFLAQVKRRYERPFKYAYITAFILMGAGLISAIGVNQNNPIFIVLNYSSFWIIEQSMYPLNYIAPFCFGMVFALFIRDSEFESSKRAVADVSLFRYLLYAGAVLVFVIVALYNWFITQLHATDGSYNHGNSNPFSNWNYLIPIAILLYSLAFSVLIFASFIDRARIMTWFLRSRLWTIGARLYLCAFLVQPPIILVYILSQEGAIYIRAAQAFYMSVANLAISLLVAFVLCLLIEMPSRNIRRLFVRFTIKNDVSNTSQFPLLEREMKYLRKSSEYVH